MSDSTSAPKRGARAVRAGLLATALTALTAIGFAPQAAADFTSAKCGGANTNANGASFAKGAQESFNSYFKTFYCAGSGLGVAYNANGSGAGIEGAQLREGTSRFWGTDDPPAPTAVALMNSGAVKVGEEIKADAVESNDGKVHVFPVAAGAIAPLVNFPEGCDPEALADEFSTVSAAQITGNAALKGILRVRFTKQKFEKVWGGDENAKWSQVFPELAGDVDCEVPVMRVVRFDKSGSTFAFKDYLRTIDPAQGWTTTYESGDAKIGNRQWPNASFGKRDDCGNKNGVQDAGDPEGPGSVNDFEAGKEKQTDFLTSACANGGGELVKALIATDGSIGYADIATARNASPTLAVDATKATAPTTPYWTQVQNGTGAFTEPTLDEANGFKTTAASNPSQKGANCISSAIFQGTPSDSFGDWSKTSGVNASSGFGICTLTYVIAFDDNAPVFKNTPEEESKARTVKDYLESALGDAAQAQLLAADYAPLPATMLTLSRTAVGEIGWNKSASGGGNSGGGSSGGNSGGGGGGGTVVISNQFSIPKKTISSKTGSATFSVKLPGAGKLGVLGTAKAGKKTIKVGSVTLTVGKAGTYSVTLKPTGAAKHLLSQKGSLKVNLTFTFSPTGGVAKTTTSSVTLKLTPKRGK